MSNESNGNGKSMKVKAIKARIRRKLTTLRDAEEQASQMEDEHADVLGSYKKVVKAMEKALADVKSEVKLLQGLDALPKSAIIDEPLNVTSSIPMSTCVKGEALQEIPARLLRDEELVVVQVEPFKRLIATGELPPSYEEYIEEVPGTVRVNFGKRRKL